MDIVVDTALDNIGRPFYIDGALMSWLDDGLEGAIRDYLGVDENILLPPQAQSLYDAVMEDTVALCYELCVFFINLRIPMVDNTAVYTVESVIDGNVVLRLMEKERLEDYLHANHEDPPF